MKNITEQDLHGVGLIVVGNQAVPMTSPPDEAADDDSWWGYAVAQLGIAKACADQSLEFGRKSALYTFRAGHAFSVLRKRHKEEGTWMALLEERKLAHSTVLQAIQLYERAKTENVIEGKTITQAKEDFGIIKPRVNPPPPAPNSPGQAARRRSALRSSPALNDSQEEESDGDDKENGDEQQDAEPQPAIITDKDLKREWMEGRLTQRADRLRLAALVLVDALEGEEAVDWMPPLQTCRDILTKFDHLEPETLPFDGDN